MANPLMAAMKNPNLDGKLDPLKPALSHIGLYLSLAAYTAIGAKIFQALEHPVEEDKLLDLQDRVLRERQNFVHFIFNGSWNSVVHRQNIDTKLLDYEQTVALGATSGIDMETKDVIYKWSYIQAVFFTSTILTTIGYGNIAPVTTAGRVFCLLFAIVGIPFTLSVIADVGQIFATLLSTVWGKYKHLLEPIKAKIQEYKKRRREREKEKNREEGQELNEDDDDDDDDEDEEGFGTNALTAFLALAFLTAFLSIGSIIFTFWEDWTFFEAFYFCFITMTTIGFGDIVPDFRFNEARQIPEKTAYMLICMIYILVGLAFTSTIIELVRRQYNETWRKMQELRAQIQAQLKLAATLKQMQDQAGKNIEFDGLDMAGDLEELKRNIAKYKKKGKGFSDIEISNLDWMDQNSRKVKAVTILIYETSV